MAGTWESQQPQPASTPQVKFEPSPTESLMSAPGEMYPSLFATSTDMDLESVMTPESFADDHNGSEMGSTPAPESGEKKTKKRKSWGQVLPEPKTNLPPRKRAKTEDEKEQRRVERVLRNRRAAQSSRERKRQEVEALEAKNADLAAENRILREQLNKLRRNSGANSHSPSLLEGLQPSPVTLSQPLFGPLDGASQARPGMMNDFILMPEESEQQDGTVDPASLSPELNPISDVDIKTESNNLATSSAATSSDVTQHPAAVLCDLPSSNTVDGLFGHDFSLSSSFDADNWGAQDEFSPSADPLGFEYNHLASDTTPEFPEFDFDHFLSDDVSGAAPGATAGTDSVAQDLDSTFGLFDSETQVPSEAFNQQPHIGASTRGCDDGVIAVGV
ncbi:Uu.00g110570.m01.CDS01 [Anthostomella pinea]|uniref:Uu.00g110570.m01.CDS01 n=1 Tax=Anthostomella pinea TaxID=933095 RepID=A0AAI8VEW4_9PEZI|nr:Uu.00g110570.m01.CDS01 [Anthostomella pinea]